MKKKAVLDKGSLSASAKSWPGERCLRGSRTALTRTELGTCGGGVSEKRTLHSFSQTVPLLTRVQVYR